MIEINEDYLKTILDELYEFKGPLPFLVTMNKNFDMQKRTEFLRQSENLKLRATILEVNIKDKRSILQEGTNVLDNQIKNFIKENKKYIKLLKGDYGD